MPQQVRDACVRHLDLECRVGSMEAEEQAPEGIEHTYDAVASLLRCSRGEIALVDSATRAWNMAFYSLPLREGDRILTSEASYASNFIGFLHRKRQTGVHVDVVRSDEYGQVDVEALERHIDRRTRLIALTHIPTNGGLVNPAREVGRVARQHGIPFLMDACQSVGQIPLDVEDLGVDMLSGTGRKFLRGPRGTGFLYVREGFIATLDPPTPDLRAARWSTIHSYQLREDARRFELWESNKAAVVGLGVAVDYALQWGIEITWQRITQLAAMLRSNLSDIPGVRVRDMGRTKCGIVTFEMEGHDPGDIKNRLRDMSINVSVSSPGSTLLDARARSLPDLLRASVHYYNTEEEIERFTAAIIDFGT